MKRLGGVFPHVSDQFWIPKIQGWKTPPSFLFQMGFGPDLGTNSPGSASDTQLDSRPSSPRPRRPPKPALGPSGAFDAVLQDVARPSDSVEPFLHQGFVYVPRLIDPDVARSVDQAVARTNSRARRFSSMISGGTRQIQLDYFGGADGEAVSQLVALVMASAAVRRVAAMMWGEGVELHTTSRFVLEGGREQIPHADSLYPNAIVVLISLKQGQARARVRVRTLSTPTPSQSPSR